ncbi:hypothetical protein CAC02_03015 [Streptococcus gallolyticus]|uniref:Uncharacterized protein n=1 Tax=Streptococcus gallolyticus TaxID=315405 RepID=A0A368UEQ0_9STRE|nr:hypothetical protein CAC02_03015 [Streptococcus gallolyticus]
MTSGTIGDKKVFLDTFFKFLAFLFLGSDLKPSTGWFDPSAGSTVQWTVDGIQGISKSRSG